MSRRSCRMSTALSLLCSTEARGLRTVTMQRGDGRKKRLMHILPLLENSRIHTHAWFSANMFNGAGNAHKILLEYGLDPPSFYFQIRVPYLGTFWAVAVFKRNNSLILKVIICIMVYLSRSNRRSRNHMSYIHNLALNTMSYVVFNKTFF